MKYLRVIRIISIKRFFAIALVGTLYVGCGGKDSSPTAPSGGTTTPPSSQTFTLSGIVTESAPTTSVPVSGAAVRVVDGAYAGKGATTDAAGNFSITGLLNGLNIEVTKAGYLTAVVGAVLNQAAAVSVRMTPTPQLVSETFTGSISGGDANCASFGGDGVFTDKPCKRIILAVHNAGALAATLSWPGGGDLDLALFRVGSTNELASSRNARSSGEESVSANLSGGSSYALHVTYYTGSSIANYSVSVTHPN